MSGNFIATICDAGGQLSQLVFSLTEGSAGNRGRGCFLLAIGSTESSDVPGISAAGATAEMRRMTPAFDAEALVLGRTSSGERVPVSPTGIVSPVVVTRAALGFLDCDTVVVNCGSFVAPAVGCITAGTTVARCLSTGQALEHSHVERLFRCGFESGLELRDRYEYLVVGECVPGGTTTALAVLKGLGYDADRLLSSSLPEANHQLRERLVNQGLERAGLYRDGCRVNRTREILPLEAVAACGDPMQPFVAGLALSASATVPVILAGGSQMLAVWALISEIAYRDGMDLVSRSLAVITTKWVAFDRSAGIRRLAELVAAPFAASCPSFAKSRHSGLRAYEDGHVKEGVGAGGAMAAAYLIGNADPDSLVEAVDASYDQLVLAMTPA